MVAEFALTMKESRRALIFMPEDVMCVEDLSGQVGEIRGIRWSEDCTAPLGVCPEGAYDCRSELGDVHFRRAGDTAKIEARAKIDRRDPSVAHPASGLWWLLERVRTLPPESGPSPVPCRGSRSFSRPWRHNDGSLLGHIQLELSLLSHCLAVLTRTGAWFKSGETLLSC